MKLANSWLILNVGGGPTDDKPTVTLTTPDDPHHANAFLNIRVADISVAYAEWSARGAEFLTEPKDHGREIRAYIRDPDGQLRAATSEIRPDWDLSTRAPRGLGCGRPLALPRLGQAVR